MPDETRLRFDVWPKTSHFFGSRQRANHRIVSQAMIILAIDCADDIAVQADGKIVFRKRIIEPGFDVLIRVVMLGNGRLHTAFRDDEAMRAFGHSDARRLT